MEQLKSNQRTFLIFKSDNMPCEYAIKTLATDVDLYDYANRLKASKIVGSVQKVTSTSYEFEHGELYLETHTYGTEEYRTYAREVKNPKVIEGLTVKRCKKCGQLLSYDMFYKNSECKDGKANTCKECDKMRQAERAKAHKKANQPAKILSLSDFEDNSLFSELKRRGYTGELKFARTVCI